MAEARSSAGASATTTSWSLSAAHVLSDLRNLEQSSSCDLVAVLDQLDKQAGGGVGDGDDSGDEAGLARLTKLADTVEQGNGADVDVEQLQAHASALRSGAAAVRSRTNKATFRSVDTYFRLEQTLKDSSSVLKDVAADLQDIETGLTDAVAALAATSAQSD